MLRLLGIVVAVLFSAKVASASDKNPCYWMPDKKLSFVTDEFYQPDCKEPWAVSIIIRTASDEMTIVGDRKKAESHIIEGVERALAQLKECGVDPGCNYSGRSSTPVTYRLEIVVPKALPLSDNEISALRALTRSQKPVIPK